MNIIMLLIPFLIMSTEFIKIGVINVTAPKIGGQASQNDPANKPKEKPLNLHIIVSDKGFTVMAKKQKMPEGNCDLKSMKEGGEKKFPTIKKTEKNEFNYKQLTKCLVAIKKGHIEEEKVIIMADPGIKYKVIVKVMDHSRQSDKVKTLTKKDTNNLFPIVIIGAGAV